MTGTGRVRQRGPRPAAQGPCAPRRCESRPWPENAASSTTRRRFCRGASPRMAGATPLRALPQRAAIADARDQWDAMGGAHPAREASRAPAGITCGCQGTQTVSPTRRSTRLLKGGSGERTVTRACAAGTLISMRSSTGGQSAGALPLTDTVPAATRLVGDGSTPCGTASLRPLAASSLKRAMDSGFCLRAATFCASLGAPPRAFHREKKSGASRPVAGAQNLVGTTGSARWSRSCLPEEAMRLTRRDGGFANAARHSSWSICWSWVWGCTAWGTVELCTTRPGTPSTVAVKFTSGPPPLLP
mmetsp:Transcript_18404/g.61604  ORF Transcript_18404/g.61604 Transcript_18404/m.61604 type:complete len:302 (-) Transcript_18404:237-1142(-)